MQANNLKAKKAARKKDTLHVRTRSTRKSSSPSSANQSLAEALGGSAQETPPAGNFWSGVRQFVQIDLHGDPKPNDAAKEKAKADAVTATAAAMAAKTFLIIQPGNATKTKWDLTLGLVVLYSVMIVPLRIGFGIELVAGSSDDNIDVVMDFLFFFDMFLCCNEAFNDDSVEGEDTAIIVTDRVKIFKRYAGSWFLIDFFSTVPFGRIQKLITPGKGGGDLTMTRLLRILKLVRLLKLARIFKLTKIMKNVDLDDINPALFSLVTLVFKTLFVAHLVSCFWFFITSSTFHVDEFEDDGEVFGVTKGDADLDLTPTWREKFFDANVTATVEMQYVTSFYWTIATMLAVGYGDIYAATSGERIYSIVTQLLGSIVFGTVIGTVSVLVESKDPQGRARKEKLDELKTYLADRDIPKPMAKQAKDAMAYYLLHRSVFDESEALHHLPTHVYNQIVLQMYAGTLEKITMFKPKAEPDFSAFMMLRLKPVMLKAGEVAVEQGDVADEISFVTRGSMRFVVDSGDGRKAIMGRANEGDYYGDYSYLKRTARESTAIAVGTVSLCCISKDDLDDAFSRFTPAATRFNREFSTRAERMLQVLDRLNVVLEGGVGTYEKEIQFEDGELVSSTIARTSPTKLGFTMRKASTDINHGRVEVIRQITRRRNADREPLFAEETAQEVSKRWIIDPADANKVKWDVGVGALILCSVISIPFYIGFDMQPTGFMLSVDTISNVFFWSDIAVNFRTAYVDSADDALVTDFQDISYNYLKTWFAIDFFSVVDVAQIVEFFITLSNPEAKSSGGSGSQMTKLLKVVRLFRLVKLVRLMKLGKYMDAIEETLGVQPAIFDLLVLMAQVTFVAHFFACFFHMVGASTCEARLEANADETNLCWYNNDNVEIEVTGDKYIAALYWAFTTMTTVGYGDITPIRESVSEKVYAIFMMMIGATVFAFVLASVSNLAESLKGSDAESKKRLATVMEYMAEKNVPPSLRLGIRRHWQYVLSTNLGLDEMSIIDKLPLRLGQQLLYLAHFETIKRISVFTYMSEECVGLKLTIFRYMMPAAFAPNALLFDAGGLPTEIYFLVSGTVVLLTPKPETENGSDSESEASGPVVIAKARCGNIVGAEGFLNGIRHPSMARAETLTEVYFMSNSSIANIISEHPFVAIKLQRALGQAMTSQKFQYERKAEGLRQERLSQRRTGDKEGIAEKLASMNRTGTGTLKPKRSPVHRMTTVTFRSSKVGAAESEDSPRGQGDAEPHAPFSPFSPEKPPMMRAHSCPNMGPQVTSGTVAISGDTSLTKRATSAVGMSAEESALRGQVDPKEGYLHRSRTYSHPNQGEVSFREMARKERERRDRAGSKAAVPAPVTLCLSIPPAPRTPPTPGTLPALGSPGSATKEGWTDKSKHGEA